MTKQRLRATPKRMPTTLREQIRKAWAQLRGRAPDYGTVPWEEREPRRRRRGPPEEDALVPTGLPETPPRSSATALPLPEPESWDVDALGKLRGDERAD